MREGVRESARMCSGRLPRGGDLVATAPHDRPHHRSRYRSHHRLHH
ncbi:hypothetical protein SGM_5762 [Streptomyces griseoaurantiacus M045]|uniref:Uncharacterized protein n=1 Tax=Streptomyces griseoaurantiacus M045 TaxID=996637 RepID=F3NRJ8_9ACTN|nr:hypothetical protein SGM_5762 [Streptomyces griseoaurantiacus M045]